MPHYVPDAPFLNAQATRALCGQTLARDREFWLAWPYRPGARYRWARFPVSMVYDGSGFVPESIPISRGDIFLAREAETDNRVGGTDCAFRIPPVKRVHGEAQEWDAGMPAKWSRILVLGSWRARKLR
jgi:hypothetical protein